MMDISVRNLNHRLALRIPTDLPLGLVFVNGIVREIRQAEGASDLIFSLVDEQHNLRCRMERGAVEGLSFVDGVQVRAGGHLQFDVKTADYFLLARDIEIVAAESTIGVVDAASGQTLPLTSELTGLATTPILADIQQRAVENELVQSELPKWVEQMAPEVVKKELAAQAQVSETAVSDEPDASPAEQPQEETTRAEALSTLAEAMESEEEVELTPEMVQELDVPPYVPPPNFEETELPEADEEVVEKTGEETAVSQPLATTYQPPQTRDTDWLVIGLIGLLILFVLLMAGILLFVVFGG